MTKSGRMIRRVFFLLILSVMGCALCFLALYTVGIPFHNYRLDQYDNSFRPIQHPAGAVLVGSMKEIIGANANDCGYFIGELRRHPGSRQDVQAFYANQIKGNMGFNLIFAESGAFSTRDARPWPYPDSEVLDWLALTPAPKDNLYLIYFFVVGDGFFDYRCM